MLGFGALVFIHELGHFIAARACGVKINEFAIGMGPTLFKHKSKKSGTVYSLRLLPIGGFVSMEGEYDPAEQSDGEQSSAVASEGADMPEAPHTPAKNSFAAKPAWMKLIISLAGPFMNILLGIIMSVMLVLTLRMPDGTIALTSNTIRAFQSNAFSAESGLAVGDKVVKVGNTRVHTGTELSYEIMFQGKDMKEIYFGTDDDGNNIYTKVVYIDITVVRDGSQIELNDVMFRAVEESGTTFAVNDISSVELENPTFINILKHSWYRSFSNVKMIWDSLVGLITGRFGLSSLSGPVGTIEVIETAAKSGAYNLLYIFTIISMNLGVFNLLPILPLDGGHTVFHFYELVARRRAPRKVEEVFQLLGVVLMFGLMIFVTIKDVIGLFN